MPRSKVSMVLQSSTGELVEQTIRLIFPASNNEVEYKVMLVGLDLTLILVAARLEAKGDS